MPACALQSSTSRSPKLTLESSRPARKSPLGRNRSHTSQRCAMRLAFPIRRRWAKFVERPRSAARARCGDDVALGSSMNFRAASSERGQRSQHEGSLLLRFRALRSNRDSSARDELPLFDLPANQRGAVRGLVHRAERGLSDRVGGARELSIFGAWDSLILPALWHAAHVSFQPVARRARCHQLFARRAGAGSAEGRHLGELQAPLGRARRAIARVAPRATRRVEIAISVRTCARRSGTVPNLSTGA